MSLINQYDIIGLQETKTDDTDSYIEITGYKIFFHNRHSLSRYRSLRNLLRDDSVISVKLYTKSFLSFFLIIYKKKTILHS